MLALSMVCVLAAFGAISEPWQPSALRLLAAAVVGLLAPLFWPGSGATTARTAARVVGWSAAAAALVAAALLSFGGPLQRVGPVITACAVLTLMLVPVHTLLAVLELHWRRRSVDAQSAREQASRTAALTLALLGSLPLWCGPLAQRLAADHDWLVDAALGISPLTHLAVASGNDLLRNPWFYQHSNLASLQVSYPGLVWVAGTYGSICAVLLILALAVRRPQVPTLNTTRPHHLKE